MRFLFTACVLLFLIPGKTQTLGGSAAYNFLNLPATPLLTASGGVNVSYRTNEVGLTANNPALLTMDLHSQLNASFNHFLGGINTYSLTGAWYREKWNTTFGGHIYFVDYGSIPQTDAAGNINGDFRPVDYAVQLSAARSYLSKWNYGVSLKFIHSSYPPYSSSALAADLGILYSDTAHLFHASLLFRNMGVQLSTYAGEGEDLPFDLQIGMTKKLANAPLGFSFTAQHAHQFDIFYNDSVFNNENNLSSGSGFFNKLINHIVVAAHVFLGANLEATLGFNQLRRSELNMGTGANGLNGFSMGLRVKFPKLQVLYARSNYQRNISYNQLGLTIQFNKLFGTSGL